MSLKSIEIPWGVHPEKSISVFQDTFYQKETSKLLKGLQEDCRVKPQAGDLKKGSLFKGNDDTSMAILLGIVGMIVGIPIFFQPCASHMMRSRFAKPPYPNMITHCVLSFVLSLRLADGFVYGTGER